MMPGPTPANTTKNSRLIRMLGIAGQGHDGQILTVDIASARNMVGYFKLGFTGTTAQRPDGSLIDELLAVNEHYYDTTLSLLIVWDGKVWRNPSSGAVV